METISIPVEIKLSPETIQAFATAFSQIIARRDRIGASVGVVNRDQPLATEVGGPSLLFNKKGTARLLCVSEKTLWNLCHRGEMPQPIRFGSAVRWSVEGLKAWIEVSEGNATLIPQ
jgi:predicted DNA-binding transcriptional regulator AlpA